MPPGTLQGRSITKVYELHGGPWHGRTVELPDERDHFHVQGPVNNTHSFADTESAVPVALPRREGTYSRVNGMPGHMEWDGWVTHV